MAVAAAVALGASAAAVALEGGAGGGATTQQLGRDLARSSTSWGGRRYEEASGWEAEEAVEGEEEVVWTLSSEDECLSSLSSSLSTSLSSS